MSELTSLTSPSVSVLCPAKLCYAMSDTVLHFPGLPFSALICTTLTCHAMPDPSLSLLVLHVLVLPFPLLHSVLLCSWPVVVCHTLLCLFCPGLLYLIHLFNPRILLYIYIYNKSAHVVDFTACNIPHGQYELIVDIGLHPRECI